MTKRSNATLPPIPGEGEPDAWLWALVREEFVREQIEEWFIEHGLPVAHNALSMARLLVKMAEPGAWEKYHRQRTKPRKGRPNESPDIDLVIEFEVRLAKSPKRQRARAIAGEILSSRRLTVTENSKEVLATKFKNNRAKLMEHFNKVGIDGHQVLDRWVAERAQNPTKTRM